MSTKATNKLTVLYIVSTVGQTGPTRQLLNLIRHIDRQSVNIHVVTLSPEQQHSLIDAFLISGVQFHSLSLSRMAGLLFGYRKLKRFIELINPDIIHSQGFRADLLSSRIRHPRKVATQRNNPFSDYPQLYGRPLGTLLAYLHLRTLRKLTVVACANSVYQESMRHGLYSYVIRNGVDVDVFSPLRDDAEKAQIRDEINLPKAGLLFLYSGPLITRKNVEYLIETFKAFNHEGDFLIVLGSGPLESPLRSRAGKSPKVIFRGEVDDVRPYLQVADYFVSASYDEGLPNSVLEALATGLPVLLSNIPSHREILDFSPLAGRLFDLDQPRSLGKKILLSKHTPVSGSHARELACTHFACDHVADQHLILYKKKMGLV